MLQRHKNENLFYFLRTNNKRTVDQFSVARDFNMHHLNYDNSTPLDAGTWSSIEEMKIDKDVLEKYVDGEYDSLVPTRVYKDILWKENKIDEVYRLLKTEEATIVAINSQGDIWKIENMINLPRKLYLLHLLQLGKFNELTNENISKLLQLFEIDYLKNVKLSDIQDMLATDLVTGTIENAVKKAEVGSQILKKVKK